MRRVEGRHAPHRLRWSRSPLACRRFADAAPRWTFCVAASQSGAESGSPTFSRPTATARSSKRISRLWSSGTGARADAQCPQPREDKTEAVNAQFQAEEFNRKLGATLHAVLAGEFPPRR